jgi:hypothetical protein
MPNIRNCTLATIAMLLLPTIASAASLNVKTGAWEMTTTSSAAAVNIPAETLAKLPPEMRAKFAAQMKASQQPHAVKSCVTQADLDQNKVLNANEVAGCTHKIISASSSKMVVDASCPAPYESTSHSSFEAITPENIQGAIDVNVKNTKIHIDIKGHWLTSSCASIAPRPDWRKKLEAAHQHMPPH